MRRPAAPLAVLAALTALAAAAPATAAPVYHRATLVPVAASGVRGPALVHHSTRTRNLWISVRVAGAREGAVLRAQVRRGRCARLGPTRFPLRELNVNDEGRGHSYTVVRRVRRFAPAGLVVTVSEGTRTLACGALR